MRAAAHTYTRGEASAVRIVETPGGTTTIFLPHLRGWLATFPGLPPREACDACDGSGTWRCHECRRTPGKYRGGPCDTCGGEPIQTCDFCGHDPIPVQIATVLGVAIERWILEARLRRLSASVTRVSVVGGELVLGRAAPIPAYVPGPRDAVAFEAAYAHEQVPLAGVG